MHDFFPYGKKSANYEEDKEFFINNLVGPDGFINRGIYDYDIFYIMKDPNSYARLMSTIGKNEKAVKDFYLVKQYIKKTGKYAIDEESFVKAVVSTVSGLDSTVLDVEKYLNNQLEEDKKRVGVYSISHDDIMTANKAIKRVDAQIERVNALMEQLNQQGVTLSKMAEGLTDEISASKRAAIKDLDNKINEGIKSFQATKLELIAELRKLILDELENVKAELNQKADLVFSEVLSKYQEQLDEFRRASKNLSLENARSLTVLKDETDKSLTQLREELQRCLDRAEEGSGLREELKGYLEKIDQSAELRDRLLQLIAEEQQTLGSIKSSNNEGAKMVQGIGRIVVPSSPKVEVPDSIIIPKNIQIISPYAFKNAVEFDKKLKVIRNKMKEKEANGEIYHEKILEIIECLMVGDWPYMFGPSGAGKGYIVKQIGELLGQKVVDGGKIGEVHTVLGYIDPQGRFMAPPAVGACINGDLIFFDEFDNGNSDTKVALNTMYSNLRDKIADPSSQQFIKFANGQIDIPINPNMRMIAAGNTDGTGSDELFTDRYPTDESIKERYKPIYVSYDNKVEARILREYGNWYDFFVKFREACEEYATSQGLQSAPGNASTRDASDIFRDVSLNAKTLDQMMSQYFVQIKDEDYRNAIARKIADHYKIDYDQTDSKDYSGTLAKAKGEHIAKQFVKRCNLGIRG